MTLTTEKIEQLSKYEISMQKLNITQLNPGQLFIPVNRGEELFSVFCLMGWRNVDGVNRLVGKEMETNRMIVFNNHDRVVLAVPVGSQPLLRVLDVDYSSMAEKQDDEGFISPITITFDMSTVFGVFDPIPSTKGLVFNSEEYHKKAEEVDEFYQNAQKYECDFADFLDWAFSAGKIVDYSAKIKGGLVVLSENTFEDEELSVDKRHYMTFRDAFANHFKDGDFADFLRAIKFKK